MQLYLADMTKIIERNYPGKILFKLLFENTAYLFVYFTLVLLWRGVWNLNIRFVTRKSQQKRRACMTVMARGGLCRVASDAICQAFTTEEGNKRKVFLRRKALRLHTNAFIPPKWISFQPDLNFRTFLCRLFSQKFSTIARREEWCLTVQLRSENFAQEWHVYM